MSNRIKLLNQNEAPEKSQELLAQIQQKFGKIPNIFKMMANSPAVLQAYLSFNSALEQGKLDSQIKERIALFIAQENGCEYCIAAHSAIAKQAGLSDEEIMNARQGTSENQKAYAALSFSMDVLDNYGKVEEADLTDAKNAGLSVEEIMEIVAVVSLNIFTNFLNGVAQTEVDFPKVQELITCACGCSEHCC